MSINEEKSDNVLSSKSINATHQINRLHAIINTVADAIISIDSAGAIKSFNTAATQIFGYSADEVIGKNIVCLMPEPYRSEHHGYIDNYLATNIKKIIDIGREARGLRKDGSEFPMALSVSETVINNERLFIGTIRDITKTKRDEELIARLGRILNDSSDEIYILNHENLSFVQTNASARSNLCYTARELTQLSFRNILSKSSLNTFEHLLTQINETGSSYINFETELKRKDGSFYPIEAKIYLSSFEMEKVYVLIVQDISERKLNEQSLKEKNRHIELRARYDRVARLIMEKFSTTHDTQAILNQCLCILADELNYPSSAIYLFNEWTERVHLEASYAPPGDIKKSFRLGEGVIGQAALQKKFFIIDEDNEEFSLEINVGLTAIKPKSLIISPLTYQNRIIGVIALASMKKLDQHSSNFIKSLLSQIAVSLNALKQYNDLKKLSDQLKKRGLEIAEKNAELEQANKMKSEFLANISHELRTPLNAVIGFSEVLKDGMLGELNSKQEEYASDIFKSGQHLLSLINDILDLSKIEADKMTLDPEPVNIKELIRNAISIVRERAFAKKIALTQNIDPPVSSVLADARQIKQMVYNLLTNAIKFTPEGGKVNIHAYKKGENFIIDVQDNGIGITPEDQTRLFKPFEQLDSSVARKYEGPGLGLVLAQRFAELHSGSISVHSKPNEGSCFTISIPYRTQSTAITPDTPLSEETVRNAIGQQKELLLLTSVKNNSKAFIQHAETQGYKSHKIFSSASLTRHLKFAPPQLVVVDEKIPRIENFDIMDKINALSSSIPILYLRKQEEINTPPAGASKVILLAEDNNKKWQHLLQLLRNHHFHTAITTSHRLLGNEYEAEPPSLIIASYVHEAPQIKHYFGQLSRAGRYNLPPILIYNNLDIAFDTDSKILPALFTDIAAIVNIRPHVEN